MKKVIVEHRHTAMIALLQRVAEATVHIRETDGERLAASIGPGLLVLVGVERGDTTSQADRLLDRILAYRVFEDSHGRMNLSLEQVSGELMLVPQFTLAADTDSGNRPSFSSAAPPDEGRRLFDRMRESAQRRLARCGAGEFGAHMLVRLTNDGPVTFRLRVPPAQADE